MGVLLLPSWARAQSYIPGQSYFGRSNYIEYIAGNMPFIISAPHGGTLTPAELPDRTTNAPYPDSTFTTDANTEQLARAVRTVFTNRFGHYPHVIICRLDRQKIDCNRDIGEGAQGNALTEIAWTDFQNFILAAKQTVSNQFGKGFYIDLHGHGHTLQRLEIGYLLSSGELALSDTTLDAGTNYSGQTSIRELDQRSPFAFSQLLRGSNSLGTLLATRGFPSVPSQSIPDPGANSYFNGGYNTDQHGSHFGGTISGLQIECNYTNVRDSAINRTNFAQNLADALEVYFTNHFGMSLSNRLPAISSLASQTNTANTSFGPLALTVSDRETAAAQLVLSATSSNTNLVPVANIVFSGSGSNRFVTIAPAPFQNGSATITVTATDASGAMASASFALTVNPSGLPPQLTAVSYHSTGQGMTFRLSADVGNQYNIEYSPDLQIWFTLNTVTNANGVIQINDKQATNTSQRFYRAVLQP